VPSRSTPNSAEYQSRTKLALAADHSFGGISFADGPPSQWTVQGADQLRGSPSG